jgi:urease accessory protein
LDNGREAGLFLARGSILRGGDLLTSEEGYIVEVRAADEAISIVTSDDPLRMARACYHLGNRHTLLEITSGRIQYLADPILDQMVKGLGLEVGLGQAPFEPEIGAYSINGHHHG